MLRLRSCSLILREIEDCYFPCIVFHRFQQSGDWKTFGALDRVVDLCVRLCLCWEEVLSLLLVVLHDLGWWEIQTHLRTWNLSCDTCQEQKWGCSCWGFGVKSVPSVIENIWSALPSVCAQHIRHQHLVVLVLLLCLRPCLGSALGWERDRLTGGLQRALGQSKWASELLLQMGFLSKQEQQSLVPLFIDASWTLE